MKQKIKNMAKILMIILLLHCIFNTNYVFATDEQTTNGWDVFWDVVSGLIDGILSIFLNIYRLIPVIIGGTLQLIAGQIANIGADHSFAFLTMEDILFNKVPILRVNFFNSINNTGIISEISNKIAIWYYALRNIAIILSLAVLIYVGIRMAISTIAEDKAKYKKMLMDWVVGFITIFLLHYIIVITVNVNDLLVGMFANSGIPEGQSNALDSFALILADDAANIFGNFSFISGMSSAIVYLCLVIMIFMFLFNYIKRMLTVAFLIIIAPIITVTYSIDKMGDRKITSVKHLVKRIHI